MLHPHRDLRGEPVRRAIEVRLEGDAVIVDSRQPVLARRDDVVAAQRGRVHRQDLLETHAQAQHLEAAGVGEGRTGPVHEPAEATRLFDQLTAGLQVEMVGIGQHRLCAQ